MDRLIFRPYPVLSVVSLAAFVVLMMLGQWQLERRTWKLDLIERLEARPKMPPEPLDQLVGGVETSPSEIEFRQGTVTGVFDHAREMPVFGSVGVGQPGYFIFTPLRRDVGPPVLINRGFVPAVLRDPQKRLEGQVEGTVTITGLVRLGEQQARFIPDNDPETGIWYWRDVAGMAAWAGLDDALPLYLDAAEEATPPGGVPKAGHTIPRLRNNHLGYAVSWFGMGLGLLIIVGVYHANHGRLGWRPAETQE